jgi:hypothetical protein
MSGDDVTSNAHNDASDACPVCGHIDPPELAGWSHHLCSGMRPCTPEERAAQDFSPETKARLLAFMDKADRCRSRAAVDARSAWIG